MRIFHQSTFNPWPLEDESVQAVITSPPYFGLRKYDIPDVIIGGDKNCEHIWGKSNSFLKKQSQGVGSNYIKINNKQKIMNKWKSPHAKICTKCQAWKGQYGLEVDYKQFIAHTLLWCREAWRVLKNNGIFWINIADSWASRGNTYPPKCKYLLPHRIAIALIEEGWILRNDVIWAKNNAMPESCQDRFSKKYEYIFMFTKKQKYYFDLDSVREPQKMFGNSGTRYYREKCKQKEYEKWYFEQRNKKGWHEHNDDLSKGLGHQRRGIKHKRLLHPKGKNVGDVWEINAQGIPFPHYAAFPEKLAKRMIKCSTKPGDIVLDPFCGSGTTLRVATKLQREGIGIDLGYKDIQEKRLSKVQIEMIL